MSNKIRKIEKIMLMLLCMLLCMGVSANVVAKAASTTTTIAEGQPDSSKNWTVWITKTDTSTTCYIKPAKSGVSGVSSGKVKIPATITYKSKSYNVTNIRAYAYNGNTSITSIDLTNAVNLKTIGSYAFKNCTKLQKIYQIGKTKLSAIGTEAFYGDTALVGNSYSTLAIPKTVTKIGDSAFYNCAKIDVVDASDAAGIKTVGTNAFKGVNSECAISVYDAAAYKLFKASKVTGSLTARNVAITYNSNFSPAKAVVEKVDVEEIITETGGIFPRTGYTLKQWNTKADGKGKAYALNRNEPFITDTGAITLYAIWTVNTYTVKFDKNAPTNIKGGAAYTVNGTMNSVACTYDVSKALPTTVYTCAGFKLDGWYTNKECTGSKVTALNKLTPSNKATVILYPKWTPITYKIRYNANGGTGTMADTSVKYNALVNLTANTYTRVGYNYIGWATSAAGAKVYRDQESVMNLTTKDAAIVNIYAAWDPIQYRLLYNAPEVYEDEDNHVLASVEGSMDSEYVDYDNHFILPASGFSCEGYEFKGWKDSNGNSITEAFNLSSVDGADINIYADLQPVTYTVSFDSNGGVFKEGSTAPETMTMSYSKSYVVSGDAYEKTGYRFAGWALTADGDVKYRAGQKICNLMNTSGSTTLYAVWKPITYKVSFNANAPEGAEADGYMADVTCTYDAGRRLGYNDYSCKGYKFVGWNTMADGSGVTFADNESVLNLSATSTTITLYAQWEPISYTIRFNVDGSGAKAPEDIQCTSGQPFTIPENDETMHKNGYRFLCWSNKVDGKKNDPDALEFLPGETYNVLLAEEDGQVVELYAVWTTKSYKIRYVTGIENVTMDDVAVEWNKQINIAQPVQNKTGYTFDGWNTREDGTGVLVTGKFSPKTSAATSYGQPDEVDEYVTVITLYAQWRAATYKIMLDVKDGTLPDNTDDTLEVLYGDKFADRLPQPAKEGYDFGGWKNENGDIVSADAVYDKDGDMALEAVWNIKKFKVTFECGNASINNKKTYTKTYEWNAVLGNIQPKLTEAQKSANKKFVGWYTENARGEKTYIKADKKIKSDMKLKADISRPTYNVTFDLGYKSRGKQVVRNTTFKYKQMLNTYRGLASYKKRAGYLFSHWYYVKDGKQIKVNETDKITGSVTLYAKWRIPQIEKNGTKLDNKNKRMTMSWKNDPSYVEIQYRSSYTAAGLAKAKINGFKAKTKMVNGKKKTVLGNELTLTYLNKYVYVQVRAKFKDSKGNIKYTSWQTIRDVYHVRDSVTFDPKGGTINGKTATKKVVYVRNRDLSTSSNFPNGKMYTPVKKGYKFAGWYYNKNGRAYKVAINSKLASGTRVYAKWTR